VGVIQKETFVLLQMLLLLYGTSNPHFSQILSPFLRKIFF